MSTGDQADFARRLRALLPTGWFPPAPAAGETEQAPVMNGILQGFGSVFAWIWGLFTGVDAATRLATCTGAFVDMFADDYFGVGLFPRATSETDAAYIARIRAALIATRNTRAAISAAVQGVTGTAPTIIEPMKADDTHALGSTSAPAAGGGYGYGTPGLAYGSLYGGQFFVSATLGSATTATVNTAINQVKAQGVIAWVKES